MSNSEPSSQSRTCSFSTNGSSQESEKVMSPLKAKPSFESDLEKLGLPIVWKTAFEHGYTLDSKVGSGTFGIVVKARSPVTGGDVVIKLIQNFSDYDYTSVKVVRELQIMLNLKTQSEKL